MESEWRHPVFKTKVLSILRQLVRSVSLDWTEI